ncbi:MAG: hypothetical protein IJ214_01725 [Clostridia bacterium]|nr:hypothetical protein [Clostridia bacterium]
MLSFIILMLIASSLIRRPRFYFWGRPFMGGWYRHYRRPPMGMMGGFGPRGPHGPRGRF